MPTLATSNKALFRVIGDVRSQNGENMVKKTIGADDLNSILPGLDERLEDPRKGMVEQAPAGLGPSFLVLEDLEVTGRDVTEKNGCPR